MKMDILNVIIGKRVFFRKCVCMMFVATVIITYMFSFDCNIVKADEWDDAVKYYSNYGNAAVLRLQIEQMAIFIFVQQEIHLRREPSIGQ